MNNRGLFDIVCNAGGTEILDLHPYHRTIAYESGCYIVLWDLEIDKKLMIHPHDYNVTCVKFCGPENEFIISLDCNYKPSIYITEWQTLTRLHQLYLPIIKKNRPVENYRLGYSARNNILVLVENYRDQHQFSIWDFRAENFNLITSSNDENQSQCLKVEMFDLQNTLQFAVVEKRCIKYWRYQQKSLELVHRIHVKDDILDSEISPLTQFFLFVTRAGKLYIINSDGQYISSLSHPQLSYCCLSLYNDYILLGSLEGEIEIYLLSSMKYVKSLKNIREAVNENRKALKTDTVTEKNMYKFKKSQENDAEHDRARQLKKIAIAKTTDLMALSYTDKNVFLYDFLKGKILTSVSGHSDKIKHMVWSPSTRKTFVTCANDGTIRVWNFIGDRWDSFAIYPPSTISHSTKGVTFDSKSPDFSFRKSTDQSYKITSLAVDWSANEIFAGDNKGSLIIYDLFSGQIKNHLQIGGFRISQIALGSQFIAVAFSTGYTVVIERTANYENQIKLEEALFEIAPKPKCKRGIKLIDDELYSRLAQERLSKPNSIIVQNKSYASDVSASSKGFKQRAITTHNVSSLRLHQIYKSQGTLSSIVLANYYIEGRVVDYEVHPSNNYLLVLSNEGYLSIFKLANGELRGKIQVHQYSSTLCLDPSGLYAVVASPFINKAAGNTNTQLEGSLSLSSALEREDRTTTERKKEILEKKVNPDQSILSLFEIGTGEYVGEIHKVQTVTSMAFSFDGSYLAVGSQKGLLTVLAIDENIRENIYDVLENMRKNPYFWSDFQLDLGEKKLEVDILENSQGDLDDNDDALSRHTNQEPRRVEVEGLMDKELQVSITSDGNRSYIRPPRSLQSPHSQSQNQKRAVEEKRGSEPKPITSQAWSVSSNGSPPEKIPTIKSYMAEKKSESDLKKSRGQPEVKATLLTNLNPEKPKENKISPVMHNISVQAHLDKSKAMTEKTRQYNLEQMDPKKVSMATYKAIAEQPTTQQFVSQDIPTSDNAVDKYLDASSTDDDVVRRMVQHSNIGLRNILPDPDDIDEDNTEKVNSSIRKPSQNDISQTKFGTRLERAPFIKSIDQDITSHTQTIADEASNMYEEISEFEKKFYRKSSESDYYGNYSYS